MMPMVFCASLRPWAKAMPLAERIWALAKKPLTLRGRTNLASQPPAPVMVAMMANSTAIIRKPRTKPRNGEVTIGTSTFHSTPPPRHHGLASCDQMMTPQLLSAAAKAAPHKPPTRAWELDEGKPKNQVIRFQTMAPDKVQISTCAVTSTSCASIRPEAMVLATAVPARAPIRFMPAASNTA